MTEAKRYVVSVAEKLCIPALEKAANNFLLKKPYTVIDHVSFDCTKLEELLRPFWGIAPLLKDNTYYINVAGEQKELTSVIREIILKGSDEADPDCFSRYSANRDEICYANQMITEFAGYCLAMVIAPEYLWEPYDDAEKKRVGEWIKKWAVMALRNSWRNNHFWFPMLSVIALEKLGIECGDVTADMEDGFSVLDRMYLSDGWYQDGEFGRFDFYLSWSHHVYPLLWTYLSKDTCFYDAERAATYKKRTAEFFDYYTHMFDLDGGVPAFGRSLSYRFAETAFFAAAAFTDCDIDYGMARRILIKNISYFMDNMVLSEEGILPPGYLYPSPAIVENYTSTGGAYWSAKTFLVLALPDDHSFWTAEESEMPIEKGAFLINSAVDGVNMLLDGNEKSGVTLYNNTSSYWDKKNGYVGRFNDMASYYSKFVYNSRSGFGISSADNFSCDNMIALETEDGTMTSRRTGFTDLGYSDGVLVSSHIPFANDKDTYIKTWVIPLGNGYHVKAHKVVTSEEYKIIEGGFSVGTYDDGSHILITDTHMSYSDGKGKVSKLSTLSDIPFKYSIKYHKPGLHILAPQSGYPSYSTDVLVAGEYIFASLFFISTKGEEQVAPGLTLEGNILEIKYGEIEKRIELK